MTATSCSATTTKKEAPKQQPVASYSPRSKIGTLLPDFPNVRDLKLPDDVDAEKVGFHLNPEYLSS